MMNKKSIILGLVSIFAVSTTVYADGHVKAELSEAKVITKGMNMGQTMRVMGKAMGQLNAAKTTEEMLKPANLLADYTSQAEVLTAGAPEEKRAAVTTSMNNLRKEIVKLQDAISNDDLEGARKQIAAMGAYATNAHAKFEVFKK